MLLSMALDASVDYDVTDSAVISSSVPVRSSFYAQRNSAVSFVSELICSGQCSSIEATHQTRERAVVVRAAVAWYQLAAICPVQSFLSQLAFCKQRAAAADITVCCGRCCPQGVIAPM